VEFTRNHLRGQRNQTAREAGRIDTHAEIDMTKVQNHRLAWSIGFCMGVALEVAPVIAQTTSSATPGYRAAGKG
jgi:hypothetical protein